MRRALVTGGTRGIGLGIARRLAAGAYGEVLVTYAHDDAGAQRAEAAAQAEGLNLRALRCDVSQPEEWQRLFTRGTPLADEGVHALVHAAGFTRDRLLMMMAPQDFVDVVNVHLLGGFLAARAAVRGMIAARAGRIVFLTSPTAKLGRPGQTNYGAAKAGLSGLMCSLVHEVSRFQITVNCVCAGLIDTALTSSLDDRVRAQILAGVPLGRPGTTAEVAGAVAWLVSEEASYVTGQTLHVDGGLG